MPKEFNFIYEKLVSDRNDIIGHIAYSIYKQDKIDYIKSKSKNGESIEEEILKSFHEISSTTSSIESYKIKAEIVLQAFFENTLSEMTTDIEKEVTENHLQMLENVAKKMKTPWWHNLIIGVAGSFVFALLIAIIAFIIEFKGSSITIEINQKPNTEMTN